ncbi:MAG TPA: hypothetical protein VG271_00180, partial [Beijerinckiaceae bacterium]|nr:hypothetical protein [Beijerinckiaceae bacterium]
MQPSEFGHMLNVALRDLEGSISLTLTSITGDSGQLQKLLTTALAAGRRNGARLTGVQLPIEEFPLFGTRFHGIPVSNSGDSGVMRFQ